MLTAEWNSAFIKEIMRMAGYIASGFVCALIIGALAVLFATTGDGWASGLYSAIPCFVGAPLAAVAWASSRKVVAQTCSYSAILIGLGTDLFLRFSTLEEPRLFRYVWEVRPLMVVIWFLLFAGWQVVAVSALTSRGIGKF